MTERTFQSGLRHGDNYPVNSVGFLGKPVHPNLTAEQLNSL